MVAELAALTRSNTEQLATSVWVGQAIALLDAFLIPDHIQHLRQVDLTPLVRPSSSMHASICSLLSGHSYLGCPVVSMAPLQRSHPPGGSRQRGHGTPQANRSLQHRSAVSQLRNCHCSASHQHNKHVQPSQTSLHLSVGLAGIAAFFLWADSSSAAEIPGKLHHLSDSSRHIGHHTPNVLMQLSSEEDFWGNVYAYIRYFFSVLLGTAYVAVRPIVGLFKNPVSAFFTIFALVGLLVFVSVTVNAMLGLSNVEPFQPLDTMTNLEL